MYKERFGMNSAEKLLDTILAGKFHRIEVHNLKMGRKSYEFVLTDLRNLSLKDLRALACKYANKPSLPLAMRAEHLIDITLLKIDLFKYTETDLLKIADEIEGIPEKTVNLYLGWTPIIKDKLKERRVEAVKKFLLDLTKKSKVKEKDIY